MVVSGVATASGPPEDEPRALGRRSCASLVAAPAIAVRMRSTTARLWRLRSHIRFTSFTV